MLGRAVSAATVMQLASLALLHGWIRGHYAVLEATTMLTLGSACCADHWPAAHEAH
jgi:hypothetical protein